MEFRKEDLVVGGKVLVPHSMVNRYTFGTIIESNIVGIHVRYFEGTKDEQKAFYSFSYLKHKYGKPTLKLLPPYVPTMKNRFEDEFKADDVPWVP